MAPIFSLSNSISLHPQASPNYPSHLQQSLAPTSDEEATPLAISAPPTHERNTRFEFLGSINRNSTNGDNNRVSSSTMIPRPTRPLPPSPSLVKIPVTPSESSRPYRLSLLCPIYLYSCSRELTPTWASSTRFTENLTHELERKQRPFPHCPSNITFQLIQAELPKVLY
jgi:hypothetical protein